MSYWWACQGKYFKRDNTGGFIQARQQDKNGNAPPFHWKNVSKVGPGDFIIAYKKGYIVSIGTAIGNPFTTKSIIDGSPAWQVPVAWTNLNPCFLAKNVWDDNNTKPLFMDQNGNMKKYMPLKSDGKGNNGFLYKIDKEIFTTYLDYIKKSCNTDLSKFVN